MIKKISDYIYYRLYKFYQYWDTDPRFTAVLGVSMTQFLLIADVCIAISRLFIGREDTFKSAKVIAYIGGGVFVLFTVFNAIFYSKRHHLVNAELFINESRKERRRNGYLVALILILPWILLIVLGRSGL